MPDATNLETAAAIGQRLDRDAVWDGQRCTWLGRAARSTAAGWRPVTEVIGPGVYDGTSGVALFLAALSVATGDEAHRTSAAGAVRFALSRTGSIPDIECHSYYRGVVGIASTAIHLGSLLDQPDMADQGRQLLAGLVEREPAGAPDVVEGCAGAILAALRLPVDDRALALELADSCGRRLLRTASASDPTWAWPDGSGAGDRTLGAGFAYGASGVGLALLELGVATGDGEYCAAGSGALRAADAAFDRRWRNWAIVPAATTASPLPRFEVTWCRGAVGIGLASLAAFEATGEVTWLAGAQAALETTVSMLRASPLGSRSTDLNMSICHGLAGAAELLRSADRLFGVGDHREMAQAVGARGRRWARYGAGPWPCGLRDGQETPGLMLGLAGIGLFYLRLYDTALAPTPLLPWAPTGSRTARKGKTPAPVQG